MIEQRLRAWGTGSPELLLLLRDAANEIEKLKSEIDKSYRDGKLDQTKLEIAGREKFLEGLRKNGA